MPYWCPERVECLKVMWERGEKAAVIASALGPGFTRNAVIGKARRLNLSYSPNGNGPRPKPGVPMVPHKRNPPTPKPEPEPPAEQAIQPPEPITLSSSAVGILALKRHHCRAVVGHDGLALYCGRQIVKGGPWCAEHFNLYVQIFKPSRNVRPRYRH